MVEVPTYQHINFIQGRSCSMDAIDQTWFTYNFFVHISFKFVVGEEHQRRPEI